LKAKLITATGDGFKEAYSSADKLYLDGTTLKVPTVATNTCTLFVLWIVLCVSASSCGAQVISGGRNTDVIEGSATAGARQQLVEPFISLKVTF
jgi:hypothetical protein